MEQWIHDALKAHGRTIAGPIEQPRIRPWSTQITVPTDQGRVWFKANCPGNAFEARLQQALAELVPDDVAAPLAIDAESGWMLTEDRGSSLGDKHEPSLQDWQEVVSQTARVQRALADKKDVLTAAGLPDYGPESAAQRFDRLVERFGSLPPSHPCHLQVELVAELEAARPQIADAADQLTAAPIPMTFQHGDVHPWNVFVDGGRMILFDFGDAMWAFAFEAMSVPYGWITAEKRLRWEPVRDAYREHWTDLVSVREYDALWNACGLTHAVNRSATWWRGIQGASEAELEEWGDAPRFHLLNVLEELR